MSKYKHALQVPTNAVHSYWASSVRACPMTLIGASELLVYCASPLRRGRRVAPFLWWGASGGSPAHARGHRVQVPVTCGGGCRGVQLARQVCKILIISTQSYTNN